MIGYYLCINGRDFFVVREEVPKKILVSVIKKKLKGKRITVPSTSFLMESLIPCILEGNMVFGDQLDHQFAVTGVEVLA